MRLKFYITLGMLCLITTSLFSQKTIRFRISTVFTDADDMDGFGAGDSDPEFLYEITDQTFNVLGEDQREFGGTNCLGTRTINDEFFTQTYDCDLPTSYRFRWRAREDDAGGNDGITSTSGDAVTSIQTINIPASAINVNQSNWTTINTYTNTASGDRCGPGSTVTWQVTLQYRVTNSGQQCKDECNDPYVLPTTAQYNCSGSQTVTNVGLDINAREPSDASESLITTTGIGGGSCDVEGSRPEDIWIRTTIADSSGGVLLTFTNNGGCNGFGCETKITYAWYTSSNGTCSGLEFRGCEETSCFFGCSNGQIQVDGRAGEDVWIRVWEAPGGTNPFGAGDQGFSLTINNIQPTAPADKCYTAMPLSTRGCNYQATSPTSGTYAEPDDPSWTDQAHPDLNPATCASCICQDGDNNPATNTVWSSNENMTWYTFDHPGGPFTIAVDNMSCVGGMATAQLGVFSNSGTAQNPSCNLGAETGYGCSVGVGQVELDIPVLPAGDYILVVDGNAGAQCSWEFFDSIGGQPLPLQLLEFQAEFNEATKGIDLKWLSEDEENFEGFSIERSFDGVTFDPIGYQVGLGEAGPAQRFSYTDNGYPVADVLYYRLRMDDLDGTFQHSNVVAVSPKIAEEGISLVYDLYPNPAQDRIYIPFQTVAPGKVSAVVYDMAGRQVKTIVADEQRNAGYHILEANVDDLPKGVYVLRFTAGNLAEVKRFVLH